MIVSKRCILGGLVLPIVSLVASDSSAALMQYTVKFTASGFLGSQLFENALVTFTSLGDTNNITAIAGSLSNPTYVLQNNSVSFNANGLNAMLTELTITVSARDAGVAGLANSLGVPVAASSTNLLGYDLQGPIGPVTGSVNGTFTVAPHPTTAGTLTFVVHPTTVTFAAALVPEPCSLGLMAVCVAGLILRRR